MSASEDAPDFNQLSESEKRAVAERILRIKESGWRPFWCPDPGCDGSPHFLLDENGALTYVDRFQKHGPNGEPLGEPVYETPTGETYWGEEPADDDVLLGLPVLDPKWAHNHARMDQRLPPWKQAWILFIMSGRGSGKTRTGVEFVTLSARRGLDGAIVGRRGTELENTHVKALIEHAHPEFVPTYLASKDILVWPNGATTFLFSAERPENIRSVNLSYAWVDEAAFMDEIETAWSNLKLATRIDDSDNPIHILITSTPTSTPWVIKMEDDPTIEVRRVSTYANRANLSADFLRDLEREYEGTRLGRQELHGEVLRDVEGALWNDDSFRHEKFTDAGAFLDFVDAMDDRVLAVDPAGSKGPRSDATGLIAVGTQHTDENGLRLDASGFYVLGDATIKGTPTEWAAQTFKAARLFKVNRIIAEKNFGGDMVKQVLTDYAKLHPLEACDADGDDYRIEVVHASQSKETRAEATVGKYEQGRVVHVVNPTAFGDLSALEKEQTMWVPKSRGGRSPSPNRVDALVWAVRALESKVKFDGQMSGQSFVTSMLKRPVSGNSPVPVEVPEMPAAKPSQVWAKEPKTFRPATEKTPNTPVIPTPKTPKALPPIIKRKP